MDDQEREIEEAQRRDALKVLVLGKKVQNGTITDGQAMMLVGAAVRIARRRGVHIHATVDDPKENPDDSEKSDPRTRFEVIDGGIS